MPVKRCQFIYIRASNGHVGGGQCENEAITRDNNFCQIHREKRRVQRNSTWHNDRQTQIVGGSSMSSEFPRLYSEDELRAWMDEARKRTDPKNNWRRGCIICGRATIDSEMMPITDSDLKQLKTRINQTLEKCYDHIDPSIFQHGGGLYEANGLPIDINGLLTSDEMVLGSPFIGRACKSCYDAMIKGKVPRFCLGNGLWTGIEMDTPLKDLTWIEEKLIARVHVSIQIQKCRMFRAWSTDAYHQ